MAKSYPHVLPLNPKMTFDTALQMARWCTETFPTGTWDMYSHLDVIRFQHEEHATLFALRWL